MHKNRDLPEGACPYFYFTLPYPVFLGADSFASSAQPQIVHILHEQSTSSICLPQNWHFMFYLQVY